MSVNCVDSTIELANEFDLPLMLIASRRQIDSTELGGGYVNYWSTETFAEYVTGKDPHQKVLLARDHGGPWQNPVEIRKNFSLSQAMASAQRSFQVDIESGFKIIHIDPSVDIHGNPSVDEVLNRIFDLYDFCHTVATRQKRKILFEIGTEEQTGAFDSLEALEYVLNKVTRTCTAERLPLPTFVVVQTGTRVMETRNVGTFGTPHALGSRFIPMALKLCSRYNVMLKEHNTDYLSDSVLLEHPRLGIHAANVAPEFGVTETRAFIELLQSLGLQNVVERFVELAFDSKKWEKWMLPKTAATDFDRAIIAGHYVFATSQFQEMKQMAQAKLEGKDLTVDQILKSRVKDAILRYLIKFNLAVPSDKRISA